MEISIEKTFGLQVRINWKEFIHFNSLNVNRNIANFVDTFNITCANPAGRYSTEISVGSLVSFYQAWVEFFRGYIEKKTVQYNSVWSTMTLSWREEIVVLTEDDIEPTVGPFKNVTDNSIIQLVTKDYPWKLELGKTANIKEYAISSGSIRKGQVLDDIVKYNDFVLIKKGTTLYKKKIPTWPESASKIKFTMTVLDGRFSMQNERILTVQLSEDITSVRSSVIGYSYQSWKKKLKVEKKFENPDLIGGDYGHRLRNQLEIKWSWLQRKRYITTPAKDLGELNGQVSRAIRELDMKCEVTITVAGIFSVDLLDVVDIRIEQEKVLQFMYVESIEYNLNSSNATTTIIKVSPFPKV